MIFLLFKFLPSLARIPSPYSLQRAHSIVKPHVFKQLPNELNHQFGFPLSCVSGRFCFFSALVSLSACPFIPKPSSYHLLIILKLTSAALRRPTI